MGRKAIDRVELHKYFWDKADRWSRVEIYQKELAENLGITQATMSLIIKDLTSAGRVKKISAKSNNIGMYVIRDPSMFEHKFEPEKVLGFGDLERCKLCGYLFDMGPHFPRVA